MTGARHLREALSRHLQNPNVVLVGEAAGRHGLSQGLSGRLLCTPLSEEGSVGLAVGLALGGQRPIVELLDPNGLSRASEALSEAVSVGKRGEGFSAPVVILAPEGSVSVPDGVRLLCAADAADPAQMLDEAMQASVPTVILLSEAALNATPAEAVAVPNARCTVLASGSAVALARAVAGSDAEVVALKQLAPLDRALIGTHVRKTGRVVLVGDGPALITAVQEAFLYLESPPMVVAADADAITQAIRHSINY